MLLVSFEYLKVEETLKKHKLCSTCHQQGHLYKFISHKGQRKDYCCGFCIGKLGKPRIQQILEDLPINDERALYFLKKTTHEGS